MNQIIIAGVGPGSAAYVSPAAVSAIYDADILIGGKRNLSEFAYLNKTAIAIGANLPEICAYIQEQAQKKKICILASGDPGVFSIAGYLRTHLHGMDIVTVPGISALQYLCAKTGIAWEDAEIISLHGKSENGWEQKVRENAKSILFTGGAVSPADVCRSLCLSGLSACTVTIGENLSYDTEKITVGSPEAFQEADFSALTLMLIQNPSPERPHASPALRVERPIVPDRTMVADSGFIRGNIPMTKEEIRAVSMAKLRLQPDSIVWDIGCGTGSVSVQCALLCPQGQVFALDGKEEAVRLTKCNQEKWKVSNLHVIQGQAPEALLSLPQPTHVFIGGSGGKIRQILAYIQQTAPGVRVVANTVTVENTYLAMEELQRQKAQDLEIVQISIAKGEQTGGVHLMKAQNPVTVISAALL